MTAMRTIPTIALVMLAVAPATAQAPATAPLKPAHPVYVVPPCAPPPEFAHWGQRRYATAATRADGDPAPPLLALDDTVDLMLAPVGSVALAAPLGKPAQPTDRGGLADFRVALSGTYRIGLGGHAWIDVVRNGKVVASVAHMPGPACSGITKMVDFALKPGNYTIQLSADADPSVRIAIVSLP